MKKIIFIILLLSLSYITIAQIKTFNIDDTTVVIKSKPYYYSLPKVIFNIKIKVKTEYFHPGPYCKFADKYLTIKNVKTEYEEFSTITELNVLPFYVPDNEACYVVQSKKYLPLYSNSSGIISSFGFGYLANDNFTENNFSKIINDENYFQKEFPLFTDLSVKRNFSNITDTTYKVIQIDSIYQKIPIYNTSITSKDFEQKAEEAANFIIKIRKRKFKLMAGMFENENPPEDLSLMISKLEELENEYLSLFIGKVVSQIDEYEFEICPQSGLEQQKLHLFYLNDDKSKPVSVNITNLQSLSLKSFLKNKNNLNKKSNSKGLFFRVPAIANINVFIDKKSFFNQNFIVPQFGHLDFLPEKILKNKKINIIFDENFGSIQSITSE